MLGKFLSWLIGFIVGVAITVGGFCFLVRQEFALEILTGKGEVTRAELLELKGAVEAIRPCRCHVRGLGAAE